MQLLPLLALAVPALSLPNPAPGPEPAETISLSDIKALDYKQSDVYQSLQNDTENTVEARGLVKRTPGGVFFTTDINWQSNPFYVVVPRDTCTVLNGDYYYKVSSFGPDQYTSCNIYERQDCTTGSGFTTIGYPGSGDLRYFKDGWNDRIGSFKCWYA